MLVSKSDNLNALCNEWADAFNKKYKLKIYLDRVYKSASKNIVPCETTDESPKQIIFPRINMMCELEFGVEL